MSLTRSPTIEWDDHQHDLKPSCILEKPKPSPPPPPVKSFSYFPKLKPALDVFVNLSDNDDWDLDSVEEEEEKEEAFEYR